MLCGINVKNVKASIGLNFLDIHCFQEFQFRVNSVYITNVREDTQIFASKNH